MGTTFLQTGQGKNMDNMNKTQKIRFKFANGEEFEAEGTLDFIEKQRDYFLELVKKKPSRQALTSTAREDSSVSGPLTPHLYATAPGTYADDKRATISTPQAAPSALSTTPFSGTRLWEQLLAQEGDLLYLRRKLRLSADEAALIILAGGREILSQEDCSALRLARSLEKSGFETGRLDRLLAPAAKLGFIESRGSRRGRSYTLTPAGLAHAFVLAEKRAQGYR